MYGYITYTYVCMYIYIYISPLKATRNTCSKTQPPLLRAKKSGAPKKNTQPPPLAYACMYTLHISMYVCLYTCICMYVYIYVYV